jgi:hypothetical protein
VRFVSETPPSPDAPTTPAPSAPAATAEPTPNGTSWDLVKRFKAEGVPPDQMLQKLKATGLDDESAKVLINSVVGAMPSDLPNAQLSPGTNVLSPGTFTLSDIGLTGPPATVGLYWMGFGAAILLSLGLGFIMTETLGKELPEDVGFYAVRIGGLLSMGCVAWGLFRYSQGITIRRK